MHLKKTNQSQQNSKKPSSKSMLEEARRGLLMSPVNPQVFKEDADRISRKLGHKK